ncbi:MAG: NADH-quinone oxidoreductase subunit C [Chloroflexia bacterium]
MTEDVLRRLEKVLPAGAIQEVQESGALVLAPEFLLEAGRYLRDTEGFDYLSNLSGVDWIERGYFEVVYHLYAMRRGERLVRGESPEGPLGPLVLKVRAPREDPRVPSVSALWPSALWQERETYDMLGIRFEGHPDLRRIYLWDEFVGHPLRKDYRPEEG